MEKQDLNQYIKKSHLKMVEKFNADLEAFRKETEEKAATLYEDVDTSFTLANVMVENGCLLYEYDGREESESMLVYDDDEQEFFEEDIDGIAEWVKFWRKCLNRAKRYWSMDTETLDKIQNGEIEDKEDEE
ncbi:MAG: hypothetical protein K6G25_06405 [Bacteroidales bacterium]|nr:hypothetical protein [Bacteroidales bacterium]